MQRVCSSIAWEIWKKISSKYGKQEALSCLEDFVFGFDVPEVPEKVISECYRVLDYICDLLRDTLGVDDVGYMVFEHDEGAYVYYYAELMGIRFIIASADHGYWAIAQGINFEEYSKLSEKAQLDALLKELEAYVKDILEEGRETLKKLRQLAKKLAK